MPQPLVLVQLRLSSDGPTADICVFSPLYFCVYETLAESARLSKALQTLFVTNHQKPPDTTSYLDFNIGRMCSEQMEG